MKVTDFIQCIDFPCTEARQEGYLIPDIELDPQSIKMMVISETTPTDPRDYYYASCEAEFSRSTLLAFHLAGVTVGSIHELLKKGVYLTTAVKCGKYEYTVATSTTVRCSSLLEREIALFPELRVLLLMGDVAIKTVNAIARRQGEPRVIPAGSTYKLRSGVYSFRGARAFPSYLQVGPSFGIEKSKQRMIAEDISSALRVAGIA